MNIKTIRSLATLGALMLTGAAAFAQQSGTVLVQFQGPGGHSNGNYGRTSALHAAGRTVILLQQAGLPQGSYVVTNVSGGNSVNSIASDGLIELRLSTADPASYQALVDKIGGVAKAGADAENAFRGVKAGDLTAGAPATIRYTVTQK